MKGNHGNIQEILPCTVERGSPVIRVIICDDDEIFLEKLRKSIDSALQGMNLTAKIHTYSRMEDIGQPILASCDIAFLDIDFAHTRYNGLDIARKLRKERKDAIIIFVTNFIEYAPEGYEVQAFRYLLKSSIHEKLEQCLLQIMQKLQSDHETMQISIAGEILTLPLSDILYIESQGHLAVIYVSKQGSKTVKTYSFYSTLSSLERQLSPMGYLRIHKSYLVNMHRIRKYQCTEAVLDNGTILKVSERSYSEQKKQYLLWKARL